jgi:hypothetical protein
MSRNGSRISLAGMALRYCPYVSAGACATFILLWMLSYVRPWSRHYTSFSIGSEDGSLFADGPDGDLFWVMAIPYWVLVLISGAISVGGYYLLFRVWRYRPQAKRGFPVQPIK